MDDIVHKPVCVPNKDTRLQRCEDYYKMDRKDYEYILNKMAAAKLARYDATTAAEYEYAVNKIASLEKKLLTIVFDFQIRDNDSVADTSCCNNVVVNNCKPLAKSNKMCSDRNLIAPLRSIYKYKFTVDELRRKAFIDDEGRYILPPQNTLWMPPGDPTLEYTVAGRMKPVLKAKRSLEAYGQQPQGFCASGPNEWMATKWASASKTIGQGCFGRVMIVDVPDIGRIALKEGITGVEFTRKSSKSIGWDNWVNGLAPAETVICYHVNKALSQGKSGFLTISGGSASCPTCTISLGEHTVQYTAKCYVQLFEAADGSLDKFINVLTGPQVGSILAQVLLGLAAMQTSVGLLHRDIKKANILLKAITPGGYWEVHDSYNGQTFYVENKGYLAMLADFGNAVLNKPKTPGATHTLGARNAKITVKPGAKPGWGPAAGSEYTVEPFTTEFIDSMTEAAFVQLVPNKKKAPWNANVDATKNYFVDLDLKPSIPVNLADFRSFPVWEGAKDVLDCVQMLMGSKVAPYKPKGIAWEKRARDLTLRSSTFFIEGTGLQLVQAHTAAAYIFPEMEFKPSGKLLERYVF